ncbi:hypothetical protein NEOKW01_0135 [Nematocida sp. AWRm80]|nr:hypothetical protein NEOKW01_0135 [Nematocida sp. AWRm80]
MTKSQTAIKLLKPMESGYTIPLLGINISLLSIGAFFSFTQGGQALTNIFLGDSMLDFIILCAVFTMTILGITVFAFNQVTKQMDIESENRIAMIETVFGLVGIILMGALGKCILLMVAPIIIAVFFLVRKREYFPLIATSLAGIAGLLLTNMNDPFITVAVGALAMALAILGTIGLESIIMERSLSMFTHYLVIFFSLMFAFKISPYSLIIFPIVALFILNSGGLAKKIATMPIISGLVKLCSTIFTRRKMKKVMVFLLNLTKVVVLTAIIAFFLMHFIAWYTGNPALLNYFHISVNPDSVPIFSKIAEEIAAVLNTINSNLHALLEIIRPKHIAELLLQAFGVPVGDVSHGITNIFQGIGVGLYQAFAIVDKILVYGIDLLSWLFFNLLNLANYIPNALTAIVHGIVWLIDTIVVIFNWLFGITPSTPEGVAKILTDPITGAVDAVIDPIVNAISGALNFITGGLFAGTLVPHAVPVPDIGQVVNLPKDAMITNVFVVIFGVATKAFLFLLGGYQYMILSNYGNEAISIKSLNISLKGVIPVMPIEKIEVNGSPKDLIASEYYLRYMDTYCEHSGVFSRLGKAGVYKEIMPVLEGSLTENIETPLKEYSVNNKINPIVEHESLVHKNLIEKISSKIGPVLPRFTPDEFATIQAFTQYLPEFGKKTGVDRLESKLKMELEDAIKLVKEPKPLEKKLFWRLKKLVKKIEKEAYRDAAMEDCIDARVKLMEYHRNYYYNLIILIQFFSNNVDSSIELLVSSSVIKTYNSLLPTEFSEYDLAAIKSIINTRTAIISKELPFLREEQAASTFYSPLYSNIKLHYGYSDRIKNKPEGYFLDIVADMPDDDILIQDDQPVKFKKQPEYFFEITDSHVILNTTIETVNTEATSRPITITENTGINLYISSVKQSYVVLVSINEHIIAAKPLTIDDLNGLKVHINIHQKTVEAALMDNGLPINPLKITIDIYGDHVGLVYKEVYFQK